MCSLIVYWVWTCTFCLQYNFYFIASKEAFVVPVFIGAKKHQNVKVMYSWSLNIYLLSNNLKKISFNKTFLVFSNIVNVPQDISYITDCPIGYHNINCSELCSFPSFGYDCQGTCQCNLSLCDHRFGCFENIGMLSSTFYLHFCLKK